MNKEMIISSTPHETRVAILEDDQVVEIFIEREHSRGVVGNVYKGRVSKVLPGMQSAFVDLGLERDAFLYVTDVISPTEEALEDDEEIVPVVVPEPPVEALTDMPVEADAGNGGGVGSDLDGQRPANGASGANGLENDSDEPFEPSGPVEGRPLPLVADPALKAMWHNPDERENVDFARTFGTGSELLDAAHAAARRSKPK